jgi:hypothetical protein
VNPQATRPYNALTVEAAVGPRRISTLRVLSSTYQHPFHKPYARAEISRISLPANVRVAVANERGFRSRSTCG